MRGQTKESRRGPRGGEVQTACHFSMFKDTSRGPKILQRKNEAIRKHAKPEEPPGTGCATSSNRITSPASLRRSSLRHPLMKHRTAVAKTIGSTLKCEYVRRHGGRADPVERELGHVRFRALLRPQSLRRRKPNENERAGSSHPCSHDSLHRLFWRPGGRRGDDNDAGAAANSICGSPRDQRLDVERRGESG